MAEWSIAAVLKTVEQQCSGGSNPSLSAKSIRMPRQLTGHFPFKYGAKLCLSEGVLMKKYIAKQCILIGLKPSLYGINEVNPLLFRAKLACAGIAK